MRSLIFVETHIPESPNFDTYGSTFTMMPRDLAYSKTFKVPQTCKPAACAVRRASMSSNKTTLSGFSNAKAITAISPAPKSQASHSDGADFGLTTISHG
jgi:hypothetical protein